MRCMHSRSVGFDEERKAIKRTLSRDARFFLVFRAMVDDLTQFELLVDLYCSEAIYPMDAIFLLYPYTCLALSCYDHQIGEARYLRGV